MKPLSLFSIGRIILLFYIEVQVKVHHGVVCFRRVSSARTQVVSADTYSECLCLSAASALPLCCLAGIMPA